MMNVIETDRMVLRPIEESDAPELFAIYSVPENVKFMGQGSASIEELRSHISRHIAQHQSVGLGLSAAILKRNRTIVGRAGLFYSTIDGVDEVELAYLIDRNHWGHGYGTEASLAIMDHAIRELDLKRIVAVIHPLNTSSLRVADKCGFIYERSLPNYKDFGNVGLYAA